MVKKQSARERDPRRGPEIVLIIELRAAKERARRTDKRRPGQKSVEVRIVDLPLVIVIENDLVLPPIGRLPINVRSDQPALGQKIIERPRSEDRIRISGVAQRISDQRSDAKILRGR